ncbi:cell wall metabolism sensor histidine kinase WalK [bacterium]|nr:cell wall metabolism sensor histidine kinase WalK [bacterium]
MALQLLTSRFPDNSDFSEIASNIGEEDTSGLTGILRKELNNELFEIIDHLDDGIFFIDLLDQVVIINKRAVHMLGLRRTVNPGEKLSLNEIFNTSRIAVEDLLNRVRLSEKKSFKETVVISHRSIIYELEVKDVVTKNNVRMGRLCIIRDISKAWIELHRKSEFLSMVAHELLNPMTPMKEGLSLVLEKSVGPLNEVQEQCLHVVYDEVNRLSRLVNDLLDINRIDSGKLRIHRQLVDVEKLVNEVLATTENKASEKSIDLVTHIQPNLFDMYADPDRIKQVLFNLIDNAIKYSPTQSHVVVSVIGRTSGFEITIRDQGFGIRKPDIKKLFDRFVQLDYPEHIQNRRKGSGLGLSIVKEIIKLHHGKIKVQSEFGKGSAFTLLLPKRKKARKNDS